MLHGRVGWYKASGFGVDPVASAVQRRELVIANYRKLLEVIGDKVVGCGIRYFQVHFVATEQTRPGATIPQSQRRPLCNTLCTWASSILLHIRWKAS